MRRKIKVIQVIADSGLGGGPKHILGLLANLDRSRFDCYLICPAGYLNQEARKIAGTKVYTLSFKSKFDLRAMSGFHGIIEEIRAENDPFGPMIVHSHGSRASLFSRLKRIPGVCYVYTEHRFDSDFHLGSPINEWVQKKILGWLNHNTDAVIAVSESVRKFLIDEGLVRRERIVVIPNAVDLRDFEPRSRAEKQKTNNPIIGSIGNLNSQKGHRFLIEAMSGIIKKYPLATLEIIGDGEDRQSLERFINKLGLEHHISLLGHKKDVEKYLKHWDVFVLPSLAETFGIVLLEAMAMKVPVVATRVGGIPDVIENEKSGLLVRPRFPAEIGSATLRILGDKDLASHLVTEGRERIKQFSWPSVTDRLEQLYLELTN
ncbi:MAG: glycosyltransferase family 4 protein [Patescibacteria group bacterium]|jgi:glycosyltransferase involved in cell wall biosynthesis